MSNQTSYEDLRPCFMATKCWTFLSGREKLPKEHLLAAGVFSITLLPLVIFANITLLIQLNRKKQKVPGNFRRLLQILCVSDFFVGTLALPTFAIILVFYPSECNCRLELLAQFAAAFFGGSSGRTTAMIAFEQSVHIKSLAIHPFMQTRKYRVIICTAGAAVSLAIAASVTVATKYGVYLEVSGAFTILDVVFLGAVIFFYLSAYHSVHMHIVSTNLRSSQKFNYNQIFAKKVTRIICVLVICYGPFITTNFMLSFCSGMFPRPTFKLFNIWSYNIVYANSFLNAIVFLCKDGVYGRKSKPEVGAVVLKVLQIKSTSKTNSSKNYKDLVSVR